MSIRKHADQITWHEALTRIRGFMSRHAADLTRHRFLLAVSGGMDSMCMLEMLDSLNAGFDVAHMNYLLRGTNSDLDAQLVRDVCRRRALTYFEKTVDLKSLLDLTQGNLQLRARELRYAWFEEILKSEGHDFVLTAHHRDDAVETFFINLIRGTGLKGLTGIPEERDHYLRPMLCFSRAEISSLVQVQGVAFREDASNETLDYQRNRVRHAILPALSSESANIMSRMYRTQERLSEEYALLEACLQELRQKLMRVEKDRVSIDRTALGQTAAPAVVLFDLIRGYGFRYQQCQSAANHTASAGVQFLSREYQMQLDRDHIFIVPLAGAASGDEVLKLGVPAEVAFPEGSLSITVADAPQFTGDRNIEFADREILAQDIALRKWQSGDVFYPLGLGGKQKLQDFFTNEKMSPSEKEGTWILTADEQIVWVVGRRLDDRFKVKDDARTVVRLEWVPADS